MPRHFVSAVVLCSVVCLRIARVLNLPSKIRSEMRLTMQTTVQTLRIFLLACRPARAPIALGLLLMLGFAQSGLAQAGTNPLNIFQNYFVTGDYVVAGWVEGSPDGSGYAPGTISVPDTEQPSQNGVPTMVPKGADIVAAYLYWATAANCDSGFSEPVRRRLHKARPSARRLLDQGRGDIPIARWSPWRPPRF